MPCGAVGMPQFVECQTAQDQILVPLESGEVSQASGRVDCVHLLPTPCSWIMLVARSQPW